MVVVESACVYARVYGGDVVRVYLLDVGEERILGGRGGEILRAEEGVG